MEKHRATEQIYHWDGGRLELPLISHDGREEFKLNLRKAKIEISKGGYQVRAKQTIILARLDFGPTVRHPNPDHQWIEGPHLHIYREGYADKWAIPLPRDIFPNIDDHWKTLLDFMNYCKIVKPPNINRELFV